MDALASVSAGLDRPGRGNWEVVHGSGDEMFSSYASMCFNPDGTAREIFAEPIGLKLSYTFPINGVIVVRVQVDRAGNVREFPSAISKNQAINSGAVAQIKNWKFKSYIVDGSPVEVVTTLHVPFHLKYEPLGANGRVSSDFVRRA